MVRQNALKIRSWADVFGLESAVTTEGWTSLFYYDHIHGIIQKHAATIYATLLLLAYLIPMYLRSSIT